MKIHRHRPHESNVEVVSLLPNVNGDDMTKYNLLTNKFKQTCFFVYKTEAMEDLDFAVSHIITSNKENLHFYNSSNLELCRSITKLENRAQQLYELLRHRLSTYLVVILSKNKNKASR